MTTDTMAKIRKLVEQSGLTHEQIGLKMGYPKKSARASVWQFINSTNPTLESLRRFAKAMGVDLKELL